MLKRNIYLLCAIGLLQGMVFYAPVATLYRQVAGLQVIEIAGIESISLLLTVLLEIPWGWAADRIGYRKTMVICSGLFFLSKLVFWRATGFAGFLLERILLAVVCAGISGVDTGLLYLSCSPTQVHRVFGIFESAQQAGMILAAGVFALWLGERYRLAALLTVISYGAALLLAFGLQEVHPQIDPHKLNTNWLHIRDHLKDRGTLLLLLAVALYHETHQIVTVFLNQLQYSRVGLSQQGIAMAYILLSLCGLCSGLSVCVCQRLGQQRFPILIFLCGTGCCLLLAGTDSPLWSILAIAGLRIGFSLFQPFQLTVQNQLIRSDNRATALSVNSAMLSSVGAVINLGFGRIAQYSLPLSMLLGAALCLCSLLLWRCSRKV